MTKNSDYGTNTGYICSYDINVAEEQPQDTTMSKERLKLDRQVGSIYLIKKGDEKEQQLMMARLRNQLKSIISKYHTILYIMPSFRDIISYRISS